MLITLAWAALVTVVCSAIAAGIGIACAIRTYDDERQQ